MHRRGLLLAALCAGCSTPTPAPEPAPVPAPPPAPAPAPAPAPEAVLREVVFEGMCDASGAISLSPERLVVADDEDNVLRAFDADRGGVAWSSTDVSAALGLPLKGKKRPSHPEVDLEAATILGGHAYWISSHGRNSKGKAKPERLQFFATTVAGDGAAVRLLGRYDRLLDDLLADPRYASFGLAAASELAPKEPGGLNIEGLTASADGGLLIGFRNPIPDRRALVVPVEGAELLLDGDDATTPRLGAPIQLDLGGQGIRSMSWWRGRYLIIAGEPGEGGVSRLYTWDGEGAPQPTALDLSAYNPEGFFSPEERDEILLLSDDGSRLVDGVPCKELVDPARRSFRAIWVRLAAGPS